MKWETISRKRLAKLRDEIETRELRRLAFLLNEYQDDPS